MLSVCARAKACEWTMCVQVCGYVCTVYGHACKDMCIAPGFVLKRVCRGLCLLSVQVLGARAPEGCVRVCTGTGVHTHTQCDSWWPQGWWEGTRRVQSGRDQRYLQGQTQQGKTGLSEVPAEGVCARQHHTCGRAGV